MEVETPHPSEKSLKRGSEDIIDLEYEAAKGSKWSRFSQKETELGYLGVGSLTSMGFLLENYILQRNATHKICRKYKHKKHIKPKRHRYMWFTQFELRPPRTTSPSFLLSSKMKRHNLHHIRCNILCSLSQSPYLFLALRIHT